MQYSFFKRHPEPWNEPVEYTVILSLGMSPSNTVSSWRLVEPIGSSKVPFYSLTLAPFSL